MDVHCGKQPPGRFEPHIDRNRCEGKGDCVAVCPHGVFTLGTLGLFDRRSLSLLGQLKGWAHDWQQAFTPHADACEACGQCVTACPERAITLVRAK
ncbi:4Fe-4S dicluster domain-containing protein [Roseateles sp. BYS87W]|uniref:Ferredoxin family protein n=1 Tax=Pelomonas baiyunensis TaxID=3299026 RepID=A0ABW7GXN2_9BURK